MLNQIFVKSLSRFLPRMVLYEPESDALFTKLPGLKCGDKSIKNPGIFLMIYLFLLQRLQNKNVILRATGS